VTEKDQTKEKEMLDEGLGDYIKLGVLLTLLAVPGVAEAENIAKNLPKNDVTTQTATNAVEKAVVKQQNKTYSGFTAAQASNIVARTLYMEARSEGETGLDAVASAIYNRAGKKAENLPAVCLREKQFSCWNKITDKTPKTYRIIVPSGAAKKGNDQDMWLYCQTLAGKLMNESFSSTIGNRNSYHTTSVTPDWDATMKDKQTIGKHVFGYLPEYDPLRKTQTKSNVYKVQSGDNLWKIAKKKNTTVDKLLEKNPKLKKNPNLLKIGYKLVLP